MTVTLPRLQCTMDIDVEKYCECGEDLAKQMQAFDEIAYTRFAAIYGPQFRNFLISRGLSVSDAEDLAVTCVTDISCSVGKYEFRRIGGFESWIWAIVRYKLVDWNRSQRPTIPLEDRHDLRTEDWSDEVDTDREDRFQKIVEEALINLPPDEEALIRLRYFGGAHSFEAIGKNLKIPEGTARVRHHRICKKLAAILIKNDRVAAMLRAAGIFI